MNITAEDWYDRKGQKLELGDKVKIFYPKKLKDSKGIYYPGEEYIEATFCFENGALGFGTDKVIDWDLFKSNEEIQGDPDFLQFDHFLTVLEILWNFGHFNKIYFIEKVI